MGFDFIANSYDQISSLVFGKSMRNAQCVYLDRIPLGASLLVLGGGTGNWLPELFKINPMCRVVYIDASSKMIAIAKTYAHPDQKIEFRIGTEALLSEEVKFDSVVLFCYLDLFPDSDLESVVARIKDATVRSTQWIIVDFVSEKPWHIALLRVMYTFFRLTAGIPARMLPKWISILERNGLAINESRYFFGHFILSAVFKMTPHSEK